MQKYMILQPICMEGESVLIDYLSDQMITISPYEVAKF